jgi:heme exporter protein A
VIDGERRVGAPPAPALAARGLSKRYGRACALAPLDVDVAPGERVAVFGPNGAGKSTLIRTLATALRPTAGSVWVQGIAASSDPAAARAQLGLVAHQTYLYPDLTAAENLRFYARLYAVPDVDPRVDAALSRVGLAPVRDRRVRTFSRGMQQRLCLARATLHAPPVLLLDEPDGGLDADATERLEELLGLAPAGAGGGYRPAVVLASHNHALGRRVCERVLAFERGVLVSDSAAGGEGWS